MSVKLSREAIIGLLQRKGLSQRQAAKQAGLIPNRFYAMMAGRTKADEEDLRRLSKLLSVPPEQLVAENGGPAHQGGEEPAQQERALFHRAVQMLRARGISEMTIRSDGTVTFKL